MRILLGTISVLLLFLASAAIAQTGPLGERTVLDGRIDILIPDDFEEMAPDLLRFKYPSENRPTLVFTNPDGSINVGFNHTNTSANRDQLPDFIFITHLTRSFVESTSARRGTKVRYVKSTGDSFYSSILYPRRLTRE